MRLHLHDPRDLRDGVRVVRRLQRPCEQAALLTITGLASAQPGYGEGGPAVSLSGSASGDLITAVGSGFVPGELVTGTVFSDPMDLGAKNADPAGTVIFTFSVRGLAPGKHRVVLSAPSGSATATFTVTGGSSGDAVATVADAGSHPGGNAAGGHDAGGELAFTGSNLIIPVAAVGLLLLVGGVAAVAGSRRRRSRTTNRI